MTYAEFILKIYNFVDSIWMVYIVGFFAIVAIIFENVQKNKLNNECARLTALNLELQKSLSGDEDANR